MPAPVGSLAALPVPLPGEAPDGPNAFQNLALRLAALMEPVATIAALPATGDFLSQTLFVQNIPGAYFEWRGSSWVMRGIAQFTNSTVRAAAIPSPVAGMMSRLTNEGFDRRYDSVTASWKAWGSGLVPIIPVAAGSGAAVAADGKMTLTAAAATGVGFDSAFSAEFARYRLLIEFDGVGTGAPVFGFRLRGGGTDFAGGVYDYDRVGAVSTTVSTTNPTAQTGFELATNGVGNTGTAIIELVNPMLAKITGIDASTDAYNTVSGAMQKQTVSGHIRNTNTYDGFGIYAVGTTLTATAYLFAYATA